MKPTQFKRTLALSLGITFGLAATLMAEQPGNETSSEAAEPTQIFFMPKAQLEEAMKKQKLKENVFYWTNVAGDPKQGPTTKQENGKTFLSIKGSGTAQDSKEKTTVDVYRVFNIPQGATKITVTQKMILRYDEFADSMIGLDSWGFHYTFAKMDKVMKIWDYFAYPQGDSGFVFGEERTWTGSRNIPAGAQQVICHWAATHPRTIDLNAVTVKFE